MDKNLGKIKRVNLKDVFRKEDKDFTPWLNEHLDELGKKLNIDIIDSTIEEKVGSFNCDIIAKDSDSNKIVVIENQFGPSNHDHLGKIFTYAAGKGASIVVWIAEKIREEHRKVLEWLNENVDPESDISLFGIEIKLLKIDNSKPAPEFDIIVKPNDWERSMKISTQTQSETQKKYFQFYSQLVDKYSKQYPKWRKVKAQPQSWLWTGAGKSGLWFAWAFRSNNRFSTEVYMSTPDKNENERMFEELEKHKNSIDSEIKGLSWEKLENKKACRIALYKKIRGNIKSLSPADCTENIKWAIKTMSEFNRVFSKYIKKL